MRGVWKLNYLAKQLADAALGNVSPKRLTDEFLLGKQPLVEYLQSDADLHFLFVNHDRGLRAAKLANPDNKNSFSAGDPVEKAPVGNYAAVMAVTSTCIHYIIGRAEKDMWFTVNLNDIITVQSETTDNGRGIAIRKGHMKFLFIPEDPTDIDLAVNYLLINIKGETSVQTKQTIENSPPDNISSITEQQHKYSISSTNETSTERQSDHLDEPSGPTNTDGPLDTGAQSTESSNSVESEARIRQQCNNSVEEKKISSNNFNNSVKNNNESENGELAKQEEPESTDIKSAELPAKVERHLANSREALGSTEPPFVRPSDSYAYAISAYRELCMAIEGLPAGEFQDKRQQIESQIGELEVLIESLSKYRTTIKHAQTLTDNSVETDSTDGSAASHEAVIQELEELRSKMADISVNASHVEALLIRLDEFGSSIETHQRESEHNVTKGEPGAEQLGSETTALGRNSKKSSGEQSRMTVDDSNAKQDVGAASTRLLHIETRHDEMGEPTKFEALDPSGNRVRLVANGALANKLYSGCYYRLTEIKPVRDSSSEVHQLTTTAGSTLKELSDGDLFVDSESSCKNQSIEMTRQESVGYRLLTMNREQLDTEAELQLKRISKKIHEVDTCNVDFRTGADQLTELETDLNAIDPDQAGINSEQLENIITRISEQLEDLDMIKDALISAQRKISLAKEGDSIPKQDLEDINEKLRTATLLSEEMGLDTDQLKKLEEESTMLLDGSSTPKTAPVSDSDPDKSADAESSIQSNEVSEYYDALRNLRRLISVVRAAVNNNDEPADRWGDTVNNFLDGKIDEYPGYGVLQSDLNEFSISEYRDIYGDGTRTTEFNVIDTKPLTATVRQLLKNTVDGQSVTDLHLPVAPDSGTRLPVIVETDAEVDRAISLLKQLPKSPDPASSTNEPSEADTIPTEKNPDTNDGDDTLRRQSNKEQLKNDDVPLTQISVVTEEVATALQKEGITTRTQLIEIDLGALSDINGITDGVAQRIKLNVG